MHRNAPLTPEGRLRLCQRIEGGRPVASAAASMGISRDRAYVWWHRYQEEGLAGLVDRSSRPHRCPTRTKASRERRIETLRRNRGLGPARIAGIVDMHASTVHRVLVRQGLNRLDHLDRVTREPIRRIEMSRPGELVHVDIKKLSRIPKGGGWRAHGRSVSRGQHHRTKVGYAFVHSAVDGYSRIAYSEVLPTRQRRPPSPSGSGRSVTSPTSGSPSNGFSPTTAAAIDRRGSTRPSDASATASLAPIDRRPMARWNASTAPCSVNGPISGPGPQRVNAIEPLTVGSTSTTITGTTRPLGAHP